MSRVAIRRVVEAFFQSWPVYAGLVVVSAIAGMLWMQTAEEEYVATGSILTDADSLLTSQSGVDPSSYLGFLAPAQYTSQELLGLIATDLFMESVVASAEIEMSVEPGARALEFGVLRNQLLVVAASGTIVQVSAITPEPELSAKLASSVIDEYIEFKILVDIEESGASEEFFNNLIEPYARELEAARTAVDIALEGFEQDNAATADDSGLDEGLSAIQQNEVDRLRVAEALAEERYQSALESAEASSLAQRQTETEVRSSFTVLDVPEAPQETSGRLFYTILSVMMFLVVGLILAVFAPVVAAMANSSVLFADEIERAIKVDVVATVPKLPKRLINPRQTRSQTADGDAGAPESNESDNEDDEDHESDNEDGNGDGPVAAPNDVDSSAAPDPATADPAPVAGGPVS